MSVLRQPGLRRMDSVGLRWATRVVLCLFGSSRATISPSRSPRRWHSWRAWKGPPPANLDLFSIQFGARGGSQHLLVSASRGSLIKRLTVLSVACQGANGKAIPIRDIEFRASAAVGGLRTDYCVAKSSAGLRALAVAALGRKPAAVLEWVGDVPAAESPYTP